MTTSHQNGVRSLERLGTCTRDSRNSGLMFVATQPLASAWSTAIAALTGERHAVTDPGALGDSIELPGGGDPWMLLGVCSDLNDGLSLLQKLLSADERGFALLVTAQGDAQVGVALLNAGADFWLPSSVGPELIASFIVATRRRREMLGDASAWRCNMPDGVEGTWTASSGSALVLDPRRMTLRIGSNLAQLSAAEFRLCAYLVRHSERWISDAELRLAVFSTSTTQSDSLVRVHVHKIRKALGRNHRCLESKRHLGYRFVLLTA